MDESLNYIERPIVILDRKTKVLWNKEVKLVKMQWQHRRGSEWTWEPRTRCETTTQICLGQKTSRIKSSSSVGYL